MVRPLYLRVQELRLPQMVQHNEDPKMTAFTVTVDAKCGTTTGISAGDRAITLRALADSKVMFRSAKCRIIIDCPSFLLIACSGAVNGDVFQQAGQYLRNSMLQIREASLRSLEVMLLQAGLACGPSLKSNLCGLSSMCPFCLRTLGGLLAGHTRRLQPTGPHIPASIHGEVYPFSQWNVSRVVRPLHALRGFLLLELPRLVPVICHAI